MWLLDPIGFVCALVLVLTAIRILEGGDRLEVSVRSAIALVLGAGGAYSMAVAVTGYLHPAHVLVLVGCAAWIAWAVWRHREAPLHHPGRRKTDFGELDSLASRGPKR